MESSESCPHYMFGAALILQIQAAPKLNPIAVLAVCELQPSVINIVGETVLTKEAPKVGRQPIEIKRRGVHHCD